MFFNNYVILTSEVFAEVLKLLHQASNKLKLTILQIFLPMFRSGFRQMAQGLLTDTYMEAHVG
jgi:hypothetical protein